MKMTDQNEAFNALKEMLRSMAENQQRQYDLLVKGQQEALQSALPEEAKVLYFHLSHNGPGYNFPLIREAQEQLGSDNVLITVAPENSYQSFYDDHLDASAMEKKTKMVIEPFQEFSARKSIDAIIYLCNYPCDGYQSPIFPEDVVTTWHIWHAINTAENLQKPLIIGYREGRYCFGHGRNGCYEGQYLTGQTEEKLSVPRKLVNISQL